MDDEDKKNAQKISRSMLLLMLDSTSQRSYSPTSREYVWGIYKSNFVSFIHKIDHLCHRPCKAESYVSAAMLIFIHEPLRRGYYQVWWIPVLVSSWIPPSDGRHFGMKGLLKNVSISPDPLGFLCKWDDPFALIMGFPGSPVIFVQLGNGFI